MIGYSPLENKLVCNNCGKDTFAIRREGGLEVKYRDRWLLMLSDATGTVLFRCRFCKSVTAYCLDGCAIAETHLPT